MYEVILQRLTASVIFINTKLLYFNESLSPATIIYEIRLRIGDQKHIVGISEMLTYSHLRNTWSDNLFISQVRHSSVPMYIPKRQMWNCGVPGMASASIGTSTNLFLQTPSLTWNKTDYNEIQIKFLFYYPNACNILV